MPITAVAGTDIVLTASDASHPTGAFSASSSPVTVSAAATLSIDTAPAFATGVAMVEGNVLTIVPGTVSGGDATNSYEIKRQSDGLVLQSSASLAFTIPATANGDQLVITQTATPAGSGAPVSRDSAASATVAALTFTYVDNGDGTFGFTFTDGATSTVAATIPAPSVYAGTYPLDLGDLMIRPFAAARPAISGTPAVGQPLTGTPFLWLYAASLGALSVARQWFKDSGAISGQTGATYTVQAGDAGASLQYAESGSQTGATTRLAFSPAVAIPSSGPTPVISSLAVTRVNYDVVSITANATNVVDGDLYAVASLDLYEPSARQIEAGTDGNDQDVDSGSVAVSATGTTGAILLDLGVGIEDCELAVAQVSAADLASNVLGTVVSLPGPTASGGSNLTYGPIYDPSIWTTVTDGPNLTYGV
ncbi:hypothetical protein BV509_18895 [Rhodovulum sulfidophilum]|uniref:Uncharacterized protein n=2 Tax=Rhodovulum visakhapatnamense TaxID=364297 RepID=A0ABS1RDM5_9RHOB|nr:hypothetical protein [Rhodovulum visakhapatnamense]MBL3569085.1 hypothetical protein [Rhodovulum visakhapatnamense]MBL3577047.1 hypothetical protein [Rhodovulum visakhapatnamense]OLS46213.1 hypothetical protein BV509_18895 [Rhodovulum sulfidophilum]